MFLLSRKLISVLLLILVCTMGVILYLDLWRIGPAKKVIEYQKWFQGQELNDQKKSNDTLESSKNFVPTREWQTVERDQVLPAGLHIKIDLQSGERKAKLIDDNNQIYQLTSSTKLVSLPQNKTDKESGSLKPSSRFRSYDELKKDFDSLNMTIKTDIEILGDLSTKFKNHIETYDMNENKLVNILTDMEYLVHQVDTAEVFISNNGISNIIIPCLNSNSSVLKTQGAQILGAASSNNPKVQIAALETNIIPLLLKHIDDEYEYSVQASCLYAVSTMIRRFPVAQGIFIENGGLPILIHIFNKPITQHNLKLMLKVVRLLEDLVLEQDDAELTLKEETNEKSVALAKERVKQYKEINLKFNLVKNEWCETLGNVIIRASSNPGTEDNNDFVEAAGKSLLVMKESCSSMLQLNKEFLSSIMKLLSFYKTLYLKDEFYTPLYNIINDLNNIYDPVRE
ncbi:nucleotide exchange factor SIL1 [Daktulosphaira vitifoliae]|uniref:nucleotide exchange factor SIL1 n=1 Tax=Daktulosphaira vitifoliae TaxID=58002 RepID=UPI0021A9B573|nr:nucleotide exchange factor SIL1 [Daktulosphaira vitifoliae]